MVQARRRPPATAALNSTAANRSGSHARAGLRPRQIVPRGDTWPYGWPQLKTPRTPPPPWSPPLPFVVEFSRPLALDGVPPAGTSLRLEATAEECAALAARFDLVRIDSLDGEV